MHKSRGERCSRVRDSPGRDVVPPSMGAVVISVSVASFLIHSFPIKFLVEQENEQVDVDGGLVEELHHCHTFVLQLQEILQRQTEPSPFRSPLKHHQLLCCCATVRKAEFGVGDGHDTWYSNCTVSKWTPISLAFTSNTPTVSDGEISKITFLYL